MALRAELTVSGFVRELQRKLKMDIPSDILLVIIMLYPTWIDFERNTMNLTFEEKDMITSWLIDVLKVTHTKLITSKLLYDYNKDGKLGRDVHKKCDRNSNTLTIVQTEFNGHIFGCFLSKKLGKTNGNWVKDNKAFVCVIRSCFKDQKPAIFRVKDGKRGYYDSFQTGPSFGASDLTILAQHGENRVQTAGCFDDKLCGNMLCGGKQLKLKDNNTKFYSFKIQEMNTFTIHID